MHIEEDNIGEARIAERRDGARAFATDMTAYINARDLSVFAFCKGVGKSEQ